jgi:hypothetical protein
VMPTRKTMSIHTCVALWETEQGRAHITFVGHEKKKGGETNSAGRKVLKRLFFCCLNVCVCRTNASNGRVSVVTRCLLLHNIRHAQEFIKHHGGGGWCRLHRFWRLGHHVVHRTLQTSFNIFNKHFCLLNDREAPFLPCTL